MVTPSHFCPWGIKATDLLRRNGFKIEDHHLTSEKENEHYKKEHGVEETPQIFIDGRVFRTLFLHRFALFSLPI
jgi:glutaredoxin